MHIFLKILVNFNEFIAKKHVSLQDIILESLPKNVIPIVPILKNFQYHCVMYKIQTLKKHSQSIDINAHLPQLFIS